MFRKILCALDFTPGSDHALHVAARMAIAADAELVLLHVVAMPLGERDRGLDIAAREVSRLGVKRVSTQELAGVAWETIVAVLEHDPAFDLAVVATHGRTGIARVVLGSVAGKVVRHAPCSVLAARPRRDVKAFEHVLCPVDFSDSSRRAVKLAAQLAVPARGRLTLVHAIERPILYAGLGVPPDVFSGLDLDVAQVIEEWAAEIRTTARVEVATRVETGGASARTLELLQHDPSYDLVVVGSHGRTGLSRVLLGSVAETIVRHAPCAVLVSRPRA